MLISGENPHAYGPSLVNKRTATPSMLPAKIILLFSLPAEYVKTHLSLIFH